MARLMALLVAVALLGAGSAPPAEERQKGRPRDIGLPPERVGRRLAQLDVTVVGPPAAVASLTAEDFTVRINLKKLREFQVDRLCAGAATAETTTETTAAAVGGAPTASYLFYFDQPLLTMAGRQRSIDIARELIERLVVDGVRAMIVSNSRETRIIQGLTPDPAVLLPKLDALIGDREQWDMYSQLEEERVMDVVRVLNDDENLTAAMSRARTYQKEEHWYVERSMRRLAITLGQLVDLDPPKALIYFADTVRSNPGEHYMSFFGESLRASEGGLAGVTSDALMGSLAFDEVVDTAAAQGIRVYSVEAQGLVATVDAATPESAAMGRTYAVPASSRVRTSDTHRTLESLAAETGGRAFLHGVRASKIADRILADSSCVYLVSFDPSGFDEDQALAVRVDVDRPDVDLRVRGRLVLQSERARKTSELLRAWSSPESIVDPFDVEAGLVPTGFDDGAYTALLQIRVPGSPIPGAVWDVGASLVGDSKVRERASGRVSPADNGVPVVLEQEWRFKPGQYEIVAVAQEVSSGLLASRSIQLNWPPLGRSEAAVGPIALLHPAPGAFVRDGRTRGSGSVLLPDGSPFSSAEPAAFVGLVCRGHGDALHVSRRVVGLSTHDFPDLQLSDDEPPCAQIRDVVPSNTLRPGYYRYDVRVMSEREELASGAREFVVLAPETAASSTTDAP